MGVLVTLTVSAVDATSVTEAVVRAAIVGKLAGASAADAKKFVFSTTRRRLLAPGNKRHLTVEVDASFELIESLSSLGFATASEFLVSWTTIIPSYATHARALSLSFSLSLHLSTTF